MPDCDHFSLFHTVFILFLLIYNTLSTTTLLMTSLLYYIRKNWLNTESKAPFVSVTVRNSTLSPKEFAAEVANRTTLTVPDVTGVMSSALEILMRELAAGRNVKTEFGTFSSSIRGHFDGLLDSYDPARHTIMTRFRVNPEISDYVQSHTKTEKVPDPAHRPLPLILINIANGSTSTTRPGSLLRLEGRRLKFDQSDTQTGVFSLQRIIRPGLGLI